METQTKTFKVTEDGLNLFVISVGEYHLVHFKEHWGQYDFKQPRTKYVVESPNGLFSLCFDKETGSHRFVADNMLGRDTISPNLELVVVYEDGIEGVTETAIEAVSELNSFPTVRIIQSGERDFPEIKMVHEPVFGDCETITVYVGEKPVLEWIHCIGNYTDDDEPFYDLYEHDADRWNDDAEWPEPLYETASWEIDERTCSVINDMVRDGKLIP